MYAIVEIAGQQFKVEEGKKIFVHRLENEPGSDVEFDKVLLIEDGETITVGEPTVTDYVVQGRVIENVRGDKVIVFKKKNKKGFRTRNGHRQNFSHIEITGIGNKEALKDRAPKKEPVKKASKKEAAVEEPVTEIKPAARKTSARKSAVQKEEKAVEKTKKTEAKKTAAKKPAARKDSKTKE